MARNTTIYVDGSTARRLVNNQAVPERRREYEPGKRPSTRPIIKRKFDPIAVIVVVFTIAAAASLIFCTINMKTNETIKAESVANLQSEVIELEKENSNAAQNLEDSVDLGAVYKKATKELGMQNASSEQIMSYESKKSTKVKVHNR
ncbi:MAG: hypothetical protein K6G63_07760 [Eubacterium sp.]|nr:hypothetical protein [Eubacterium sp.]